MSSYTSELVVGSAIVAAIGVAAYMAARPAPAQPESSPPSASSKKSAKKKKSTLQESLLADFSAAAPGPRIPKAAASPVNIPGGFAPLDNDELSAASGSNAGSSKKKKKKTGKKAPPTNSAAVTPLRGPISAGGDSTSSQQHLSTEYSSPKTGGDGGSWTRVENRRKGSSVGRPESASDAGITTSVTEEEGSITGKKEAPAEEKLTLAERLLSQPAKTAVDDMLEGPKPGIARVLRVPQNYDRPSGTAAWGDYEDADDVRGADADEDDDWNLVSRKKTVRPEGSGYASAASITATAPKASSGAEPPSKNTKKNAKKREAQKAIKEANDAKQKEALDKHMKELHAARGAEQSRTKSKQSGGMSASLNDKGQLVWE